MPWVKGQSGNPSGRPRGAAGVAEYIRTQTNDYRELIDRLLELSRRDDGKAIRETMGATIALLERGLGKPMQPQEITATIEATLAPAYPPGWRELPTTERVQWLQAHRARMLGEGDS